MTGRALMPDDAPTVRLAMATEGRKGKTIAEAFAPTVRLAHVDGAQGTNTLVGRKGVPQIEPELAPALLVSFYYIDSWDEHRSKYCYRDWALDSGAFSAFNSGVEIDLGLYIDTCNRLLESDKTLTEVYALDVIGDGEASLRNCERMWEAGIQAIPTYHLGSPQEHLEHIGKTYPKIALGGVADRTARKKLEWAEKCFGVVWPKKIHGFAMCSEAAVMRLPFHSVDSTSWELGPCAFGSWKAYGKMSVRGSSQNLKGEIEWYMELERKARWRWRNVMRDLE